MLTEWPRCVNPELCDTLHGMPLEKVIVDLEHDQTNMGGQVQPDEIVTLRSEIAATLDRCAADGTRVTHFAVPAHLIARLCNTIEKGSPAAFDPDVREDRLLHWVQSLRTYTFTRAEGEQIVAIVKARTRRPG